MYDHIYIRGSSRWMIRKLPDWLKVEIVEEKDSKYVFVHSRIHVNKEVKLTHCYSLAFSDVDILKDIGAHVFNRWVA